MILLLRLFGVGSFGVFDFRLFDTSGSFMLIDFRLPSFIIYWFFVLIISALSFGSFGSFIGVSFGSFIVLILFLSALSVVNRISLVLDNSFIYLLSFGFFVFSPRCATDRTVFIWGRIDQDKAKFRQRWRGLCRYNQG